jgi:hypothetical protein
MPELRSGARQPRSPPNPASLQQPVLRDHSPPVGPVHAFVDSVPSPRRAAPRRRAGGAGTGGAAAAVEARPQARTRVRTRATVAKEAAVGNNRGIVHRSRATAAKQPRANNKPPVQTRAAPGGARQRGVGLGRVKQPVSRVPSRERQAHQDPFHPDDEEDAEEEDPLVDQDSRDLAEADTAEKKEDMEEESAGRSAEKVAGADEEGSAAPLPEKVQFSWIQTCRRLHVVRLFH